MDWMSSVEGFGVAMPSEDDLEAVDVGALVGAYAGVMFRVAHAVLRSRQEAEDVVQDSFVKVLERRGRLGEVREMRVWLVKIAWNLALDRRRRIRPEQMDERFSAELAGKNVPADVAMAEAGRMAAVLREIERLPKKEREALLLSAMEELGTAEMAAVLGRSESATRALLYRARTRLKQRMGGER